MIKKMLAMLVAISCAFGAWADTHISGTDFTGLTAGPFALGLDDEGQASNSTFWYNGDESDFEGTIIDGGSANYLDFESNITNPLYRTINDSYGLAPSSFQATPIGTGLFIDTHVQFTPYLVNENHPAPTGSGEDKLIVWVRETEVDGDANLTNLIITAGYVAQNGNVSASNYVANLTQAQASALCSGQHRLTIKSYQNITANSVAFGMGFVVYIDEAVVEYIGDAFADGSIFLPLLPGPGQYYTQGGGHNKLLPSLMSFSPSSGSIDDYSKLSAVGYAGMGKIGDVIFDSYATTYPAFAGDDRYFTVEFGDDVYSYMYNDVTYYATNTLTAPATAASVTISNVVYASGYKHKDDLWRNGSQVVSNRVDASNKDYGTFYFADGTIFTLAGFQANYLVVDGGTTNEYQTLFGNATENGAIVDAKANGTVFTLTKDTVINEAGYFNITIGEDEHLAIDLNGHTLRGSSNDDDTYTIRNLMGYLTITDSSASQTGAVLGSLYLDGEDLISNCCAIYCREDAVETVLLAGTYEDIVEDGESLELVGGTYLDLYRELGTEPFYLAESIATGSAVTGWNEVDGFWYATVGIAGGIAYPVTFSTNTVVVAEYTTNITAGATLPNAAIPAFTGGAWDIDPTGAVISAATNFNYTIAVQLSYFPQSTIEEQWADRDGTAAKPFVIRNDADVNGLKGDIAKGYNADKYFEVVANGITLTDWVGIGSSSKPFSGTLIGGGNTINVTFAAGAKDNGLFAYVSNATLSNLTVNVTAGSVSGQTGGAAFVGKAAGSCTFTALKATGSLGTSSVPVTHNTGGICTRVVGGDSTMTVNFNCCTNEMTIYANYTKVGGILATREGGSAIIAFNNCVNSADISNANSTVAECSGTGGMIGWTGQSIPGESVVFSGCVNTGMITAAVYPGNFVGYAHIQPITSGVNVGLASLKPSGTSYITGLDWATVSGDIATFVTPVANVGETVTYKLMQNGGAAQGFTLTAADAVLTIDSSFYAYTGTVSVDESLAEDYNLRETAIANGTIYSLESKTPADPWAPTEQTDAAASNKVVEIFGDGSDVANHVTTLAQYEALVTYIKSVTSQSEVPTDLTADQKTWMWKSFILGADPLFVAEPEVEITSLTANATAGKWDFIVKVTEGELTTAHSVAAAKVAALVKVTDSLSPASWSAPDPEDVHADLAPLLGTNLIKVTVDFGTDTSGFMKVSE